MEPVDGSDLATVALDGSHLAEHVRLKHGRIVVEQAVATRDEARPARVTVATDAMSQQPARARDGHNLARGDFLESNPPDGQQVTRMNGGEHTRTGDAKPDPSEDAQDFRGQLNAEGVPRI
jgi:hypothetical protein